MGILVTGHLFGYPFHGVCSVPSQAYVAYSVVVCLVGRVLTSHVSSSGTWCRVAYSVVACPVGRVLTSCVSSSGTCYRDTVVFNHQKVHVLCAGHYHNWYPVNGNRSGTQWLVRAHTLPWAQGRWSCLTIIFFSDVSTTLTDETLIPRIVSNIHIANTTTSD